MQLLVSVIAGSSSAPSCFVALPPRVASALFRDEGVTFLVLRVQPCPHLEQFDYPVYVGWDGSASDREDHLGLHPEFARALGLTPEQRVEVEAIPHHPALAGSTVSTVTSTVEEYALVTATAGFIEQALMNQVRVVCPGLKIPVRLPGRAVACLQVSAISTPTGSPEFLLLDDDVDIIVMRPNAERQRITESGESDGRLPSTLRALAMPLMHLRHFPTQLLCRARSGEERDEFVNLTRTEACAPDSRSCPALLKRVTSADVPEGHMYAPPHIWRNLRLTPLTPVLVEKLHHENVFSAPDKLVFLRPARFRSRASTDETCDDLRAAVRSLLGAPTIVFPGMVLGPWVLSSGNREADFDSIRSAGEREAEESSHTEYWDKPWKGSSSSKNDESSADRFSRGSDVFVENEPGSPRFQAWRVTGEEQLECVEDDNLPWYQRDITDVDYASHLLPPTFEASSGGTIGARGKDFLKTVRCVLEYLRPGVEARRTHTESSMGQSKLCCERKASAPKVALITGPAGSGRTTILRRVTYELRRDWLMRTVWVRCRSHAKDPLSAILARIEKAFKAAKAGQPAVIIFDDIDTMAGGNQTHDQIQDNANKDKESKPHAIASAIAEAVISVEVNSIVHVVMTTTGEVELDEELRSPGLITRSYQLTPPNAEDRALMLAEMLSQLAGVDIRSVGFDDDLRKSVCAIAASSDGFEPRDLRIVVERALVIAEDAPISAHDLTSSVRTYVPASRAGLRFDLGDDSELGSWNRVGGLANAKNALQEAFELPSKFPFIFSKAPIRLQTGILLYGPPGCGKSLLAKISAQACGLRSISVKGPELLSKYIGESEAEVRRLFQRASKIAPCVVIFDEFDALAPRRGGESTGVADRVVNTLLTMLDGVERLADGVFVIVTTSRPELIDPAVLRPGRIDRWVPVDFPDESERLEILRCHCLELAFSLRSHEFESALKEVAAVTEGMTGADLRGILADARSPLLLNPRADLDAFDPKLLIAVARRARSSVSVEDRARYQLVRNRFARDSWTVDTANDVHAEDMSGKRFVRVALR
jgi:SpoVK/Ycf46/Vps4 family AAA+-type ATPase